jgi:hypothetical protein
MRWIGAQRAPLTRICKLCAACVRDARGRDGMLREEQWGRARSTSEIWD